MGTDDLVTWLREQLDEDERVARAAADSDGCLEWWVSHAPHAGRHTVRTQTGRRPVLRAAEADSSADEDGEYNPTATFDPALTSEHAARWDPARALREVEAKRRILDLAELAAQHEAQNADDPVRRLEKALAKVTAPAFGRVVRLLALPYADRSGYRQEWAPGDG